MRTPTVRVPMADGRGFFPIPTPMFNDEAGERPYQFGQGVYDIFDQHGFEVAGYEVSADNAEEALACVKRMMPHIKNPMVQWRTYA